MTTYAYCPLAYDIAMQITGRNTQAIQNRYTKVANNEHDLFTEDDLEDLILTGSGYGDWGTFWDVLNKSDRGDEEMLDLLNYIVGDSW